MTMKNDDNGNDDTLNEKKNSKKEETEKEAFKKQLVDAGISEKIIDMIHFTDQLMVDAFGNIIEIQRKEKKDIRSEMKDKFGEVFTPKELIEEMMNKLREIDPSVFKNPHLRWLDPANGTGNFPMVVFEMLNDGLKDYNKGGLDLRDEKTRKNHIIKNMLYMVELQPDNVLVSQKIFGILKF